MGHGKRARIGFRWVVLAMSVSLIVACAPEAPPNTPVPTPTQVVVTATPTSAGPTLVPTLAGPTATPQPTSTPRPVARPTSAPSGKPNTVYIPGGEFVLGSDAGSEDETPRQSLTLSAYNIDVYAATNAEYQAFVGETGHAAPRNWTDGSLPAGLEDHPVVWVNWQDAADYCAWAGKRLPTEFEWEMAVRGTDGRTYPWGDTFDAAQCNSKESNLKGTTPVGAYPDGQSPFGIYDGAGNVWEWTSDWYQAYRGSLYELSRYGTQFRVLRGGSWFDGQELQRTTARKSFDPNQGFSTIGFRCAE